MPPPTPPEPPPELAAAAPSSTSWQRPAAIAAAVLAAVVLISVLTAGDDVDHEADKRRAERIVLTADDLPSGWSLAGAGEGTAGGFDTASAVRELEDCAPARSADDQLEWEEATSPDFKGAGEAGAGSKAFVYASAGNAKTSYGDLTSRRAKDCVTDSFITAFEPRRRELQLRGIETRSITFPTLGDGTSAFRVKLTAGPREATVAAYLDYVVLRADRAVAVLVFVSAPEPISPSEERSAADAVMDRMQA